MPELVNRSVASPAGTRLALGMGAWPRSAKNSTNRRRISAAGNATIRGSGVWTGGGIGGNGTQPIVYGGRNAAGVVRPRDCQPMSGILTCLRPAVEDGP